MQQRTVYWIEGDGIGPDVWGATRPVLDAAVRAAYGDERRLDWQELLAGEKAYAETGEYLPEATLTALHGADLAMKGPLATPVGTGFRSLNVTLRQALQLYACIRPVKYFPGIQSPLKAPEKVDMVVFRENTEDVYAGIEWPAGSPEAKKLAAFLREELGAQVDDLAGIGIKPMTEKGSKRLVRKALQFAVDQGRSSVTLVHKGNIMKYTEGAFRGWGYEVAEQEFGAQTVGEGEAAAGKIVVNDRIADAMFQEVLLAPEKYDVIATSNLNGDYLSDALAAQVGGVGLAPGVNMSDELAFFEPTHGTAPGIAGQDKANPGSLILSGALLLDHIGWTEAARRVRSGVEAAVASKAVTGDLASQIPGATTVGCQAFGERIGQNIWDDA